MNNESFSYMFILLLIIVHHRPFHFDHGSLCPCQKIFKFDGEVEGGCINLTLAVAFDLTILNK